MAQVVIQDVATLKLKHPEWCGDEYSLFKDNALFDGSRLMVSVFMVSVSVYSYSFWHISNMSLCLLLLAAVST
jgi:hypothetical protein